MSATVTVNHPDDAERKAIIGITGQYRAEGSARIGVRLVDLDRAIRESTGAGLIELLEQIGPRLRDHPADRLRLADAREATVRSAENSSLNDRNWCSVLVDRDHRRRHAHPAGQRGRSSENRPRRPGA